MANANAVIPAPEPTTFAEYFQTMPDVYNGVYNPIVAGYTVEAATPGGVLMTRALRFPSNQVPAVWAYVGGDGQIRTLHHLHQLEVPPGQPSAWENVIFGFVSNVYQMQIAYVVVDADSFFDNTGAVRMPTVNTFGAAMAALPANQARIGPYVAGDANTENIYSRRAIIVPHAYVPLMFGRVLTPREAWEQVGATIIQDGQGADCEDFIDFLRAAGTSRPPAAAGDLPLPSILCQPGAMAPPAADAKLLAHIGRKLRQLLPGLAATNIPGLGPHFAQKERPPPKPLLLPQVSRPCSRPSQPTCGNCAKRVTTTN
jgi:hypothetical protein